MKLMLWKETKNKKHSLIFCRVFFFINVFFIVIFVFFIVILENLKCSFSDNYNDNEQL